MADSSQLTQLTEGLSMYVGLVNQLSWEGSVQNYVILTGISEQPDLRKGILKQEPNKPFWKIGQFRYCGR